jgi:hypothetical protein
MVAPRKPGLKGGSTLSQTLELLRTIQPQRTTPETPVFTTTTGTPIEPKTFSAHWYRCLRALGIRVRGRQDPLTHEGRGSTRRVDHTIIAGARPSALWRIGECCCEPSGDAVLPMSSVRTAQDARVCGRFSRRSRASRYPQWGGRDVHLTGASAFGCGSVSWRPPQPPEQHDGYRPVSDSHRGR